MIRTIKKIISFFTDTLGGYITLCFIIFVIFISVKNSLDFNRDMMRLEELSHHYDSAISYAEKLHDNKAAARLLLEKAEYFEDTDIEQSIETYKKSELKKH